MKLTSKSAHASSNLSNASHSNRLLPTASFQAHFSSLWKNGPSVHEKSRSNRDNCTKRASCDTGSVCVNDFYSGFALLICDSKENTKYGAFLPCFFMHEMTRKASKTHKYWMKLSTLELWCVYKFGWKFT